MAISNYASCMKEREKIIRVFEIFLKQYLNELKGPKNNLCFLNNVMFDLLAKMCLICELSYLLFCSLYSNFALMIY